MLDGAVRQVEVVGPAGAVMVGGGAGVNVPPTVTAVVLAAGVIGGLFTVLAVLVCCRYCCADVRRPGATLLRKRFVITRSSFVVLQINGPFAPSADRSAAERRGRARIRA